MNAPTSPQPLQPGDKVGSYELTEKLEESAALLVFNANDPLLDRRVVIKQLLPPIGDHAESFRERSRALIEQYRELSRQHKRIIDIIELIDDERGQFIVMEHITGESLDVLLSRGKPIAAMSVLRVLRSTSLALELIHSRSLVHGDLRPTNLIVTSSGTVKIADLGLTQLITEQEALNLNTVRYMAPELCRGEAGDARSDLYALGFIAYEMLVGRPAFEETFKAILRDPRHLAMRWVKWHTNARATVPPAHELNAHVPPVLSELIARLMEKDPAKRINSARELIDAIERHFGENTTQKQTEQPSAPAPTTTSGGGDTAALPTQSRLPMWIAIAVAVVLIAGAGFFAYDYTRKNANAQAAAASQRETLDAAKTAYKDGEFTQARAMFQSVADTYPHQHTLGDAARASVLLCDARLNMLAGDYDQAQNNLEAADATGVFKRNTIRDLLDEVKHRQTILASEAKVNQQFEEGELDQAAGTLRQWRMIATTQEEQQTLDRLQMQLQSMLMQQRVDDTLARIDALIEDGQTDAAIEALIEAQDQLRQNRLQQKLDQLVGERDVQRALTEARAAEAAGDWATAIIAYNRALDARVDPALTQQLAEAKMNAALAEGRRLFNSDDFAGAEAAFTRALGFADSDEARGYLARMETAGEQAVFIRAGDEAMANAEFAAAVRHYEQAIELDDSDDTLLAKLTAARLRHYITQGQRLIEQGQFLEARTAFEQADRLDPSAPGAAEGLRTVERWMQYLEYVEEGDAARTHGLFREAKLAYTQARDLMDIEQIQNRLDDAEYEHLVAQARSYMNALRWESARAMLISAARIHDTEFVKELMREVAKEIGDG